MSSESRESEVVVVIFYFSLQDAQANLPSRRGRDVPSSHKNEYGVMIGKKAEKAEKEEIQPRAELEASMQKKEKKKKRVLNESEPQEARRCKGWGK